MIISCNYILLQSKTRGKGKVAIPTFKYNPEGQSGSGLGSKSTLRGAPRHGFEHEIGLCLKLIFIVCLYLCLHTEVKVPSSNLVCPLPKTF